MISAILFGGHDSHKRERMMVALPVVGMGSIAILLFSTSLPAIAIVMAVTGG